jgi:hypothetical protein
MYFPWPIQMYLSSHLSCHTRSSFVLGFGLSEYTLGSIVLRAGRTCGFRIMKFFVAAPLA